jgi:hypothetical protein
MNSTALQGWQFNDNSRSSWDIVWTCLTTIFACTWTVLRQGVPARNKSQALITASKLWVFTLNFLAPESSYRKTNESDSWLYSRTKPLVDAQGVDDLDLMPHVWSGRCLNAGSSRWVG